MLKHPMKFRLPALEGHSSLGKTRNFPGAPLVASRRARERHIDRLRRRNPADHVRGLLRDHDDRSVGVTAYEMRKYRSVDDAQRFHPVDPQLLVHDGFIAAAHAAGPTGVMHRRCGPADVLGQRGIVAHSLARLHLHGPVAANELARVTSRPTLRPRNIIATSSGWL